MKKNKLTIKEVDSIIKDMHLSTQRELTDLEFEAVVNRCASHQIAFQVADRVSDLACKVTDTFISSY